MDICAIVPVKSFGQSKSRLADLLDRHQRIELSRFLLQDTLSALTLCHELGRILVVASDPSVKEVVENLGLECLFQSKDYGVNSAVMYADRFLSADGDWASITIPCDLPLLLPEDIDDVCKLVSEKDINVVVCPSYKFDGTNLLARNPYDIFSATRYDNDSFQGHLEASIRACASTCVVLCTRLMIDLDTPADLQYILTNNTNEKRSVSYLWKKIKANVGSSFANTSIKEKEAMGKANKKKNANQTDPAFRLATGRCNPG